MYKEFALGYRKNVIKHIVYQWWIVVNTGRLDRMADNSHWKKLLTLALSVWTDLGRQLLWPWRRLNLMSQTSCITDIVISCSWHPDIIWSNLVKSSFGGILPFACKNLITPSTSGLWQVFKWRKSCIFCHYVLWLWQVFLWCRNCMVQPRSYCAPLTE